MVNLPIRQQSVTSDWRLPGVLVLPAWLVGHVRAGLWAELRSECWGPDGVYAKRRGRLVDIRAHGAELDVLGDTPAAGHPAQRRRVGELREFIARLRLLEPKSSHDSEPPLAGAPADRPAVLSVSASALPRRINELPVSIPTWCRQAGTWVNPFCPSVGHLQNQAPSGRAPHS